MLAASDFHCFILQSQGGADNEISNALLEDALTLNRDLVMLIRIVGGAHHEKVCLVRATLKETTSIAEYMDLTSRIHQQVGRLAK